jgi:c-di-GMP-binding flagellar brake protein YcgR
MSVEKHICTIAQAAANDRLQKGTIMRKAEKRKFPRLSFDVELKYKVLNSPSPKTQESRVKNISTGGLCIMILEKVKIRTPLKLEISLPHEDKPIVAKGKVAWVEKLTIVSTETYVSYDCGVEFVDISPQDQESINRHIMFNIKDG